eukprot:GHVO01039144.1.p1 GENE.GHVO01039144.1~~GHVO01039144.1.p1  ORF type:complete len:236 (-),score=34.03 GHVO01039144.1:348-1055(-)
MDHDTAPPNPESKRPRVASDAPADEGMDIPRRGAGERSYVSLSSPSDTPTPIRGAERLIFSPCGNMLFIVREGASLLVYPTFEIYPMFELKSEGFYNTFTLKTGCWLPDCQHIAMGSEDCMVHIWRLPAPSWKLANGGHRAETDTYVLTSVSKLVGHSSVVNCCTATPTPPLYRGVPLLASCGVEKMIRVWSCLDDGHYDKADVLRPDNRMVCVKSEEEIDVTQAFALRAELSQG